MKRTLAKTICYKLITTLELAVIAWVLTGSFEAAGKFGAIHAAVSSLTYAGFDHLFESLWSWFK